MIAKKLALSSTIILVFLTHQAFSQNTVDQLIDKYVDYVDAPREVAYAHLNKSVYVEGEMLGFQAYVFDKITKERSMMTSNLYCTITDNDGKVIKEKLVLMQNGIASNVFNIDSTFTKDEYTFKAFTNYMLNFDEQNHFEQKFKVIYADKEEEIKLSSNSAKIDLQLLPEGGHLITDVFNNVAVIAKNEKGEGIPNASVSIVNLNDELISEFKLNEFGIGKTIFKPMMGESYKLKLVTNEHIHQINISDIKPTGLALSLTEVQDKVIFKISTNENGLKTFGNRNFNLAIHNGGEINTVPFSLNNQHEAAIAFESTNLFTGVNIFTLFDENNNPILERLYFNYNGVLTGDVTPENVIKKSDSITVVLNIKDFKKETFNNISVSVLPGKTKSYNQHNNIFSSLYIQPYINGAIENGATYFKNRDQKTRYNLDLLLMSQGWSSYNWNNIFKGEPLLNHAFERGIDVVATVNNNNKGGTYMVYPLKNNNTEIFELKSNQAKFSQENLVPIEGESFKASLMKNKGKTGSPGLYVRFHPSNIPMFTKQTQILSANLQNQLNSNNIDIATQSWNNAVELDEIVLTGSRQFTRAERLNKKAVNSRVDVVSDRDRMTNIRLSVYLNRLGWFAEERSGNFTISNPRVNWGPDTPLVFLDDALLTDYTILSNMNLEVIDIIEYDLYGSGGGIRGNAGYIKIFTDPAVMLNSKTSANLLKQTFPLTFAKDQKFYTPVYKYYNTTFFEELGVIGWFDKVIPDDNGRVELKFPNTNTSEIKLFIEGVVNGQQLISSAKSMSLN
ncbi:hypothetical protein FJ651_04340 [Paucihalobacter ruber]|uniref:Uncharacterized protein n=1 Tax=Paucihalobacter ruber TaxID=2567861 RepID=A0A506PNI7_9FLAO|nr:hypothetical protein [Paucihalobacter ruber]TPV34767.1 hypothetical protein FJ651_04340 [Paucihalobacter ruber]